MTSSEFASVANDGRIEIWDVKEDPLTPLVCHFDKDSEGNEIKTPKTVVRYSNESPVILTGNLDGEVDVYRTYGFEHVEVSENDQRERLMQAIKKEDFTVSKKENKS